LKDKFPLKKFYYFFLLFAVLNILLSIVVSAFVSHTTNESVMAINYAISMQQLHGLAILILFNSKLKLILGKLFLWTNFFFSLGLIFFCINIYVLKLLGVIFFSFLTPLGGVAFLIGWLLFVIPIVRRLYK